MRGTRFFGFGIALTACALVLLLAGEAGFISVAWADKPDKPPGQEKKPSGGQQLPWGVDRIDADKVWPTNKGTGIRVAVVDTGIDIGHPDLVTTRGINFVGSEPSDDYDDSDGHGTGIAGVIAALDNGEGVVGVGPEIEVYAVRVREKHGIVFPDNYPSHGTTYNFTDLYEGMQWCLDNGIQVINFSLGTWTIKYDAQGNPRRDHPLHDWEFYSYIQQAATQGIVIVAAAGNQRRRIQKFVVPGQYLGEDYEDTQDLYDFPASYPEVIAVSATGKRGRNDYFASFSNFGPAIELAAPGASILTTDKDGGYGTHSGTSLAAPHVVGVAALVLAEFPLLTSDGVRTHLQATAEWLDRLTGEQQGFGLVDAGYAVVGQRAPARYTLSPRGKLSVTWGKLKGK